MKNNYLKFILMFLTLYQSALAGIYRLESESFITGRNGYYDNKFESPIAEYISASYESTNKRMFLHTNFGFYIEPNKSQTDPTQKDAHLYTGDINYQAIEGFLKIRAGRSFDTHYSIGANTIDGAATEASFLDHTFNMGAFFGIERKPEHLDFEEIKNSIGGVNIRVTEDKMYPISMSGKFQQRFYKSNLLIRDERLAELDLSKPFDFDWNPLILSDATINIDSHHWDRFEFGTDFYPEFISAMRVRAMGYEIKKEDYPETPIFAIFSKGRLYETSFQIENQFSSKFLASILAAYDNYQASYNDRQNGYRSEFETRFNPNFFGTSNTVYYFNSYGGTAYGDRIKFSQKINDRNDLYEEADITHYDKITKSKRFATNLTAGLNHWYANQMKFTLIGEYNNNNAQVYDARVALKLTYLLWNESI